MMRSGLELQTKEEGAHCPAACSWACRSRILVISESFLFFEDFSWWIKVGGNSDADKGSPYLGIISRILYIRDFTAFWSRS